MLPEIAPLRCRVGTRSRRISLRFSRCFRAQIAPLRPNSCRMRTYPNRGLNAFIMNTCRKEGWGPRRLAQNSTVSRVPHSRNPGSSRGAFAGQQSPLRVDESLMSRIISKSCRMNTYEKRVGGRVPHISTLTLESPSRNEAGPARAGRPEPGG